MSLLEKLSDLTNQKKEIEKQILSVQSEIYTQYKDDLSTKDEGTFNFEDGEYKIKIIKKENVTVDQKKASELDFGFTIKRSFSKTEYNKLNDEQKKAVNKCLTTKPAKPSFTVEKL